MFFKQRINIDASISYFFGCGGMGKAVAVDVLAGDAAWYLHEAQRLNVEISYVFDTHIHADHVSGGRALAAASGAAYLLHSSNNGKTAFAFTPVNHGDEITAGNAKIRILHTPGHTEDSVCLLVSDHRRGTAPWFAITGDTLLVGSVGRPDLVGREKEMAAQLWSTLQERLLVLPAELEVFPGHTAGSTCGADISGKPSSTIGFERRNNPLLGMGREEFIAALIGSSPERPADVDRIVASNLGLEQSWT